MPEATTPLLLDLVEWIAKEPRRYTEVMAAWRTSCPRLTIWEDAIEQRLVHYAPQAQEPTIVITPAGVRFLRDNGRG
jgi:hypothetical protein